MPSDLKSKLAQYLEHMADIPPWGYFRTPTAFLYVAPKCGTTSLRAALLPDLPRSGGRYAQRFHEEASKIGLGPFEKYEIFDETKQKLLAIRHPVERFKSLWRDCQFKRGQTFAAFKGLSPWQLFEIIQIQPDDYHWSEQSEAWMPGIRIIDYREALTSSGLPNIHKRQRLEPKCELDQSLIDAIQMHYAEDLRLWATI